MIVLEILILALLAFHITVQRTQQRNLMSDLAAISDAVARETTVVQSAVTLLNELAQELRDAANDPAAVQALADSINSDADALAAAVEANTPAPPAG